jgi:hypothetical protein
MHVGHIGHPTILEHQESTAAGPNLPTALKVLQMLRWHIVGKWPEGIGRPFEGAIHKVVHLGLVHIGSLDQAEDFREHRQVFVEGV